MQKRILKEIHSFAGVDGCTSEDVKKWARVSGHFVTGIYRPTCQDYVKADYLIMRIILKEMTVRLGWTDCHTFVSCLYDDIKAWVD